VGKAFDNDLLEVANNRGEDEGDDEEVDEEDTVPKTTPNTDEYPEQKNGSFSVVSGDGWR
jgi:hypothetical protein